MYDHTGSYDATFYAAGVGIAVSGLMLSVMPWLRRYDRTIMHRENTMVAMGNGGGFLGLGPNAKKQFSDDLILVSELESCV